MRSSFSSMSISTSSASGSTATVTAEVWMRPGGLGLGHPLDAVHAALVLEPAVGAAALDDRRDLLDAADAGLVEVDDLDLPALALGVAGVHAEQLGGEQRRLVAAGAGADLEHDVALVVGVVGRHLPPQLFLERGQLAGEAVELLAGHLVELVVLVHAGQHLLGLLALGVELAVAAVQLHRRRDLGQPFAGIAKAVAVGQELGVGELLR